MRPGWLRRFAHGSCFRCDGRARLVCGCHLGRSKPRNRSERKSDWGKVGIAVLSATTIAGPLIFLMPEHVFFGIHTIGFGGVLALISVFVIFAAIMGRGNRLP
jgi:hypothetical protein